MSNFHTHSDYSVRDGVQSAKKIATFQKEIGKDWFCVTDHGSMAGHPECFEVAKDLGMNFIAGCEFYVVPDPEFDGKLNVVKLAELNKQIKKKTLSEEDRIKYINERDKIMSLKGYNELYYHLTVFAINQQGLLNLYKINNNGDFYHKTRVFKEDLLRYNEGLIVLSGCPGGEFLKMIDYGYYDLAEKWMKDFKEVYGDRLYFELMFHDGVYEVDPIEDIEFPFEYYVGIEDSSDDDLIKLLSLSENWINNYNHINTDWLEIKNAEKADGKYVVTFKVNESKDSLRARRINREKEIYIKGIEIARKLKVKIIGSNDSHYTKPKDRKNWLITRMAMIGTDKDFTGNYNMMADNELFEKAYPGLVTAKELDDNENEIISRYEHYEMFKSKYKSTFEDEKYFERLVWTGFKKKRLGTAEEEIALLQIPYELAVIQTKSFDRYFINTRSIVKAAFEKGVLVGPGRGSGAGSECVFDLFITETDPIKYGLMFERFLNPGRNAMPDIDLDLASTSCENFSPNQEYKDMFFTSNEELVSDEEISEYWKRYSELRTKVGDNRRAEVLKLAGVEYFEGFIGDHPFK